MHSGAILTGPAHMEQAFAIDEIPVLIRAGSVIFGRPTPEVEWPHCAAGASGWVGRAQQAVGCMQAALWMSKSALTTLPSAGWGEGTPLP